MRAPLISIVLWLFTIGSSSAAMINNVVAKLDRHGAWTNGAVIPVQASLQTKDDVLAQKILAAHHLSGEDIRILDKQDVDAALVGCSGFKAMLVRARRIVMFPPLSPDVTEHWVIIYAYRGGDTGWWSRVYPVDYPAGSTSAN